MRITLKLAMVLIPVMITGCTAAFTEALLSGAAPVISEGIAALIESLFATVG